MPFLTKEYLTANSTAITAISSLSLWSYNLGQNKWNIWTTPPPISMMPKWRAFAPSRLHHCFGGDGG